jgi:2-methylcitrate dehydratase PrpD
MGLEKETLVHALGITGSTAAGLFAFLEDGATVKHMHAGRASVDGLLAALLAENGMTGPRRVLEAKEGFFNAYSNHANPGEIIRPLADQYEILFAYHKIHSACGHAFPAIDAALLLREAILEEISSVEEIEIKTYRAAAVLDKKTARSVQEARFSIPFLVGLALVKGRVSQSEWVGETLKDPQIKDIAARVSVQEDSTIAADFPKSRSAVLTARMADGRVIGKRIDAPRGMPDNPVNEQDIEQKFYKTSEGILEPPKQAEIVRRIRALDTLRSMTELTSLLKR